MPQSKLALIFDMDGVVTDNLKYHKRAWQAFFKNHQFKLTDKLFDTRMNGCTNTEILQMIFKRKLSKNEISEFIEEKENLYRKLFRSHLRPVPGLIKFLAELRRLKIPIALATAAPSINVRFVLKGTGTQKFFKNIVDAENVKHGKPSPEIFLKAAHKLKTPPKRCVVFEDAPLGLMAAQRAGMRVVGVATTYRTDKLRKYKPNLIIRNFSKIKLNDILKIF